MGWCMKTLKDFLKERLRTKEKKKESNEQLINRIYSQHKDVFLRLKDK